MILRKCLVALLLLTGACAKTEETVEPEPVRQPVIDMHRHAAWPGADDAEAAKAALAEMDASNVVLAALHITSADDVGLWLDAAPDRFIGGPMTPCPQLTEDRLFCFPDSGGWPDKAWFEEALKSGALGALGELLFNYADIAPDDPRMADYWALAAKYDAPVFVHTQAGPPPGRGPRKYEGCCPAFNPDMGSPSRLRLILERYPNLRVSMQHGGFAALPPVIGPDSWEETTAILRDYPNVYLDMTVLNSAWPPEDHAAALKRFIDAGFADRIMFGTDGFPTAPIIARLNSFEFLTDEQRRGILYDNAARFFGLSQETVDAHYGR